MFYVLRGYYNLIDKWSSSTSVGFHACLKLGWKWPGNPLEREPKQDREEYKGAVFRKSGEKSLGLGFDSLTPCVGYPLQPN